MKSVWHVLLAITLVQALGVACNAAPRPNIVVLLCDDLGYGDLSCFAHPTIRTPHLDQLAADGVKLLDCYSAAPVCSPSRAGLLTGRHPYRLGIYDWIPENSGIFLRPTETTLPQLLLKAGYHTCHVGKWHLNSRVNGSEPTPGDAGFEHWLYTQNNAAPRHLDPDNFTRNGTPTGPLKGPSSHILIDEATQWLDRVGTGQPFYLNVWFHEPHEPVAAANEYLARYPNDDNLDRRHYYGDVTQMDAAVGKLLKYLDTHGLRENTFIVFTSDNGPETLKRYKTANRSYGTPGPLRGMKLHITEAGYRVPGIIRWPGHVQPGTVSNVPVCNVDLLPTCCELAGVELPSNRALDGTSLIPMFSGQPLTRPHPLYWQYDLAQSTPWTIAMRDGDWKVLSNATLDKFQLYHVADDLGETHDQAASQPELLARMSGMLKQLHNDINDEGSKSGNPPPKAAK